MARNVSDPLSFLDDEAPELMPIRPMRSGGPSKALGAVFGPAGYLACAALAMGLWYGSRFLRAPDHREGPASVASASPAPERPRVEDQVARAAAPTEHESAVPAPPVIAPVSGDPPDVRHEEANAVQEEQPEPSPRERTESEAPASTTELDDAIQSYQETTRLLKESVLADLQKKLDAASAKHDDKESTRLGAEREAFDEKSIFPGSLPIGPYERAMKQAKETLLGPFAKVSRELAGAGDQQGAAEIIRKYDLLTADSPADRELRQRGLFRDGRYYILPLPEVRVRKQYGDADLKCRAMDDTIAKIQEVIETDIAITDLLDTWDVLVAEIRKRQDRLNRLPNPGGAAVKKERMILNNEIQQLNQGGPAVQLGRIDVEAQLDMLFRRSPGPPGRQQLVADFHDAKNNYVPALDELRGLVNEMNRKYSEFDLDAEVKGLLKELRLKIGPSDSIRRKVTMLAREEKRLKTLDPSIRLRPAVPLDRRKKRR